MVGKQLGKISKNAPGVGGMGNFSFFKRLKNADLEQPLFLDTAQTKILVYALVWSKGRFSWPKAIIPFVQWAE